MKKKAKEEKKKQDSFSTESGNKPILCVPLRFSEETLTGEKPSSMWRVEESNLQIFADADGN